MLSSNRAKKVISWLPKNRVLLETDGPFAKLEGNIVYPSNVISVLTYLSDIWNIPYDEVRSVMKLNLVKLLK